MAVPLRVVRTVKALRAMIAGFRSRKSSIVLVPTMGALHDGHISLVRLARRLARLVIAGLALLVAVRPARAAAENFPEHRHPISLPRSCAARPYEASWQHQDSGPDTPVGNRPAVRRGHICEFIVSPAMTYCLAVSVACSPSRRLGRAWRRPVRR